MFLKEIHLQPENQSGSGSYSGEVPAALTSRGAVLSRLRDGDSLIPDAELEAILDAYRHDSEVHRALIDCRVLSAAIVHRLIRLVTHRSDLDRLIMRHAADARDIRDLRAARPRPVWWRHGLGGFFPSL